MGRENLTSTEAPITKKCSNNGIDSWGRSTEWLLTLIVWLESQLRRRSRSLLASEHTMSTSESDAIRVKSGSWECERTGGVEMSSSVVSVVSNSTGKLMVEFRLECDWVVNRMLFARRRSPSGCPRGDPGRDFIIASLDLRSKEDPEVRWRMSSEAVWRSIPALARIVLRKVTWCSWEVTNFWWLSLP